MLSIIVCACSKDEVAEVNQSGLTANESVENTVKNNNLTAKVGRHRLPDSIGQTDEIIL